MASRRGRILVGLSNMKTALESAEVELQDWLDEAKLEPERFKEYDMTSTKRTLREVRDALKEVRDDDDF